MTLMFPKGIKRKSLRESQKDEPHLKLIRQCPCLACGKEPAEAAHVKYGDPLRGKSGAAFGRKPHDKWVVPLCPDCHRNGKNCQHSRNERVWWEEHRINPLDVAERLYEVSRGGRDSARPLHAIIETMRAIIRSARRGTL